MVFCRSFGCTVIELISGVPPYRHLPKEVAVFQILENEYPPFPSNISSELKDFLLCCFQKDPNKRSTTKQLLNHPWIQKNIHKSNSSISSDTKESIEDIFGILRGYNKSVDSKSIDGRFLHFVQENKKTK